jgi:FkbM family methyltransferase
LLKNYTKLALARFDLAIHRPSRVPPSFADPDVSGLPHVEQVVDVGVNYGTPWLYDAFPEADLLLIDPLPQNGMLSRVLRGRPHTFISAACGAEPGEAEINVDQQHPGRSSLLDRTALSDTGSRTRPRLVPVRTLDEIVSQNLDGAGTALGLKIDTEGFELHVLRGASETLKLAAWVICEVSVRPRFVGSYRFEELLAFLASAGFRVGEVLEAPRSGDGSILYLDVAFVRDGDSGG